MNINTSTLIDNGTPHLPAVEERAGKVLDEMGITNPSSEELVVAYEVAAEELGVNVDIKA